MKPTAVFIGWQCSFKGKGKPFPLFNIIGGNLDGSTVSLETLRKEGIDVPPYPEYKEKT